MSRRRHHPRRQMTCNPHLLLRYFWPTYSMPPIASHTSSRQLCVCVHVCMHSRSRSLIPARFSFTVAIMHSPSVSAYAELRRITVPWRLFCPRLYTIGDTTTEGGEERRVSRFRDKRGQFLRRYNRARFGRSACCVPEVTHAERFPK